MKNQQSSIANYLYNGRPISDHGIWEKKQKTAYIYGFARVKHIINIEKKTKALTALYRADTQQWLLA